MFDNLARKMIEAQLILKNKHIETRKFILANQLSNDSTTCYMKGVSRQQTGPVQYLDREDLNGHVVVQQLSFPHASEAPPGFHLDQLQRFVSHKGGRG